MYLRIGDNGYFLVTVLSAYSRYVVHWELLTSMHARKVELVIQDAIERTGARTKIATDNVLHLLSRCDVARADASATARHADDDGVAHSQPVSTVVFHETRGPCSPE